MTTTASAHAAQGRLEESFYWPDGFSRVPNEDWVRLPIKESGKNYDDAGRNGWQRSFDPVIAQALSALSPGDLLIDYSCGTGPLAERVLASSGQRIGVLNIDPSPKLLRVALEKLRDDDRVAFRLLNWIEDAERLQSMEEAIERSVLDRGVKVLASTNAIHLYHDVPLILCSWLGALCRGGLAVVTSGNIRNPASGHGDWLLGDAVVKINDVIIDLVQTEAAFEKYRAVLGDEARMSAHVKLREEIFLPVRTVESYLDAFSDAGFEILHVFEEIISVPIDEFYQGLSSYHGGVLSWIGGSPKVESAAPTESAIRDRLFLIRYGLERLFPGRKRIPFTWTYMTCRRP